jgi:hypothetical protein
MLPVTDRFLESLRETHIVSVAAYLFRPGEPETPIAVPVISGSVNTNADARIRRQATIDVGFTLQDDATVELVRSLPFGGYCSIERGIRYADGSDERVPLGYFRVESIQWTQLEGVATLTLADRYAQVQDEPFVAPYSTAGLHPTDAILAIMQEVFADTIAYHVETDPASEPVLVGAIYDQDRTEAISDLTQAIAAEAIFDAYGDLVIRPRTSGGAPVWTIDAGAQGSMVAAQETLDRSSVRNGVSLRGQEDPEAPPLYGLAIYDDATSPIRWGGPFGRVVLIAESTAVQTQAQADAAAASLLNLRLGLSRTLAMRAVPNPALEPGDAVTVVFPGGRSEVQTINETSVGLSPDSTFDITTTSLYLPGVRTLHGVEAEREFVLAMVGA